MIEDLTEENIKELNGRIKTIRNLREVYALNCSQMINYKDNSNYDILCTALYQERENLFKLIKRDIE